MKYENDNESDPARFFLSSFMGERRELNPRVVDSQSTALVHLATSAPEKPIYLSTVISSKNKKWANVCSYVGRRWPLIGDQSKIDD